MNSFSLTPLPVDDVLDSLKQALGSGPFAVLTAPPGAGKTTRVPLVLLDEPWLNQKNILMLEPRRLAAISCAGHMAGLLGEPVGRTVGYQIRMDRRISAETRIEVITEGILTRRLQGDPALEGIGLVIFDEFHERNIHSDLGLAFCIESAQVLRNDLKILVMSATMEASRVSALLNNAPVIESKGKLYDVSTIHIPLQNREALSHALEKTVALTIRKALEQEPGDILVFLPGAREIRQVSDLIQPLVSSQVHVRPLAGNLTPADQGFAILPSKPGERKIVLATAIAETSVTIQGIRVVIDAGLMRVPKFSPGTGMTRLETIPVSRASADQRRGRAGRLGPGVCFRLWSEHTHAGLVPYSSPEIMSSDLAHLALELSAWGVSNPSDLKWMDLPPENAFNTAVTLLKQLDAIDETGRITAHGRKLSAIGIHPRLSHMIIRAGQKKQGRLACMMAAILSERDFLFFPKEAFDTDIRLRLEVMDMKINGKPLHPSGFSINQSLLSRVIQTFKKLCSDLDTPPGTVDTNHAGRILAFAYPDRISKKRALQTRHFLMASGNGAIFPEHDPLSASDYIVAANLDGKPQNALIFLAAPYDLSSLTADFHHFITTRDLLAWDQESQSISGKKQTGYGKLVLHELPLTGIDPDMASEIMVAGIKKQGLSCLPWTPELKRLRQRIVFLKKTGGFDDFPDWSEALLESRLEEWLGPFLIGLTALTDLKTQTLESAMCSMLPWHLQQHADKNAPTHLIVPSQSRIALSYGTDNTVFESPVLAVRIQEMFGLKETPAIAGGRIPVTLHLLSPARRVVQITRDLAGFWKNTYADVKKDLLGRYPKHFWPDDPAFAPPTRKTKRA